MPFKKKERKVEQHKKLSQQLSQQLFLYGCFDIAAQFYQGVKRRKMSERLKQKAAKQKTRTCSKRQRDREYLRQWRAEKKLKESENARNT